MLLIETLRLSEPSRSWSALSIPRSADSRMPSIEICDGTFKIGLSATPVTETFIACVVSARSSPSMDVTVTPSWKLAFEFSGGVTERPSS